MSSLDEMNAILPIQLERVHGIPPRIFGDVIQLMEMEGFIIVVPEKHRVRKEKAHEALDPD